MKYLLFLSGFFIVQLTNAQQSYKLGETVMDFTIPKILNNKTQSSSFYAINKELLIVDFFGTWCKPCLNALPHVSELQQKFNDKVQFLLVSNEDADMLNSFIKKRSLTLPVAVDANNAFTKMFSPVSYPYTVVINKQGKIISIPKTAEMTEENIEKWLNGNSIQNNEPVALLVIQPEKKEIKIMEPEKIEAVDAGMVKVSQDFIYAAKTGSAVKDLQEKLNAVAMSELASELNTDEKKKAFWINIYNGFTQLMLRNDPAQYSSRGKFFGSKQINIAGKIFSLDEIEHDILRRSKVKWGLGYINKLFPGKVAKQLRVDTVDYRLHFALNCGAKSCPPIAFYKASDLDRQLALATKAYLSAEMNYDIPENTIHLPAIMGWFRGDFGGKKNMIKILKKLSLLTENAEPHIKFKKYDWTVYLNNFSN